MKQLSELVDTSVVDATGKSVGAVDELILDCESGRIERVIVKTPNRTRFSVAWSDLTIRRHRFILNRVFR